jgi:molecular chaperone GrpE
MNQPMNREEILQRFETLLDGALAAENPPGGIDAEILSAVTADAGEEDRGCDSYALWAAMTGVTQEVKLQGRAFKDLNDTLGAQASRITAAVGEELRAAYKERERELQRETERRCRKEILGALIDLRDRLGRGVESVRAGEAEMARTSRQGWLARLFSKPAPSPENGTLAALKKGYELGMERLDQTLGEFNVREIRCEGEPFDPRRMNAIDREVSNHVPEGTVLEVYRSGYEWNGEVFRPGQVKVSCSPAPEKGK